MRIAKTAHRLRGFTTMEILVSLAILALLSALIIGALAGFRDSRELTEAEEKIASALREARAKTLASEEENQFGVHFEPSRIIVFAGPVFSPSDPQNKIINISDRVEIFDINFSGESTVFKRLTGEASPGGNVSARLKKDPSQISTIYLNSSGLIYVE